MFKALSEPNRIDILKALKESSYGVLELCRILEVAQPLLSHHLKTLAEAGLVETKKEGTWVFYRRAITSGDPLKKSIFASIDSTGGLAPHNLEQVRRINAERSHISQEFFSKTAEHFDEYSFQTAHFSSYREVVIKIIQGIKTGKFMSSMEIGPGKGDLLKILSRESVSTIAVDFSPEMLALTQKNCEALSNVSYLQKSLEEISKEYSTINLLALNMVLHHIAAPEKAFENLSHLLSAGGYALVIDLCAHEQEWVREKFAHLWLGFNLDSMKSWAEDAGLKYEDVFYVGLRNGFQVQLVLFKKNFN